MKSYGCGWIVAVGILLTGCWANPSLVKIQSDPPGARVSYEGQDLGVTPISIVLACPLIAQRIQLALTEQPTREVPLYKRPIRYYVPWYAVLAAGFFTFSTTWRSEACTPDDFTVMMVNGEVRTPMSTAEADAKAAQEQWIEKEQKPKEADRGP